MAPRVTPQGASLPLRVALTYGFVAALWILTTDTLLTQTISEVPLLGRIAMYKGWGFVAVTSLLLYIGVRRGSRTLQREMERRMAAQAQAEASEAKFRSYIEHAPSAVFVADQAGNLVDANPAAIRLLGYEPGVMLNLNVADAVMPEDRAETMADFALLRREGRLQREYRLRRVDGQPVWVLWSAVAVTEQRLMAFCVDITERKAAGEALRENERFVRAVVDSLSAHIAVLDDHGTILMVNQAWRQFAAANGLEPGRASEGVNYLEFCDSLDNAGLREAGMVAQGIREVGGGRRDSWECEYACHSPNERRWFSARVTRFPGARPGRVVVAHENITQRKLAEERVAEALAYNRLFIDVAPVGVLTYRATGETLSANATAARIIGCTVPDLLRQNFRELPSWRESGLLQAAETALTTGKPQHLESCHPASSGRPWRSTRR